MKKCKDIITNVSTTSLVTEQRGSWKWQEAFRVATYIPRLTDTGRILWESRYHSGKMSLPQIINNDVEYDNQGSMHNKPVSRAEAIKQIGINLVRKIENHGWKFEV